MPRLFGPRREDLRGGLREAHNKEYHNLCSSQNITRMIKSKDG
jgi:hypothetical protein